MTEQNDPNSGSSQSSSANPPGSPARGGRRWRLMAWGLAGLTAVVTTVSACGHHRHKDWHSEGPVSPERVTKMVDKVFSRVDANEDQKAKITEIANRVVSELTPMRAQMRSTRTEALNLLSAETIDRDAIEALRADRMSKATEASSLVSKAMADIAEVLTPEQRITARDKISKRMGRHWGRHSE